jgi:filamentous hemagglutinin family protein
MNPSLLNRKAEGGSFWCSGTWRRWGALGFALALMIPSTTRSEITLDGTMGPKGTLPGPDFRIGAELGKRVGHNLFHSFGEFNINTGESGTFTGPAAIDNVISRVTGGSRSSIDGPLRSTIPSANLWFINPNGVLFGKNASLDVDGSFHVGTADYLKLKDGVRFDAKPSANDRLLTTAPPEAFGFLGKNPAPITFTESRLNVREGKMLSVVGGDIKVTGGALSAPSGRINIASVDAAGEVAVGKTDLGASGFERRGNIRVSNFGTIDTSGEGGGAIFIRGGEFVVDGGLILAETLGNKDGVGINVKTDSLSVTGGALNATTFGSGKGGDLRVQANSVRLSGFVCLFGISCQSVGANTVSTGDAGNLSIMANSLEVRDGTVVDASTFGSGYGGDLLVEADRIFLSGGGLGLFTGIAAHSFSTGDAGDLTVQADTLTVRNGAEISAHAVGVGHGGNVTVKAEQVLVHGEGATGFTGITAQTHGKGSGGNIQVQGDALTVRQGAVIGTGTFGTGRSGNVSVSAEQLLLDGDGASGFTGITVQTEGRGAAGDVRVKASNLTVRNEAAISANTFGVGRGGNVAVEADELVMHNRGIINASTEGTGHGGNVSVKAREMTLRNVAVISSITFGAGDAGNVTVEAERVLLDGKGTPGLIAGITARTLGEGAGGNVSVRAGTLTVRDGGLISASTFGAGRGGNVTAEAEQILLDGKETPVLPTGVQNTGITAQSLGQGGAGEIRVEADTFTIRDGALISAGTIGAGRGGRVIVEAKQIVLDGEKAPISPSTGGPRFTGVIAQTQGEGAGGDLSLQADALTIRNGAEINAGTFGAGGGGNINVGANDIVLDNGAIGAVSRATGLSGSVSITAHDTFRLFNGGSVTVETEEANAGDISLNVGNLLHLRDGSSITTSVAGGKGSGGNITIDPTFVVLDGGSKIVAQAKEGSGGNINITTNFLFQSPDSAIDASSEFGQSGTVTINSPDTNILGGITMLPETFLDAAALMKQHCAARAGGRSSIVARGSAAQMDPDRYLFGTYFDGPVTNKPPSGAETENGGHDSDFPAMTGFLDGSGWGCGS